MDIDKKNYLIWSNEHRAWWRPESRGYTVHVDEAGIYDRNKALSICAKARDGWEGHIIPSEIPVRQVDVIDCQTRFDKNISTHKKPRSNRHGVKLKVRD